MWRARSVAILLALAFWSTGALAQGNTDVFGQVYGPSGAPITRSVLIEFTPDDGHRPPEKVFTDSNGRFTLQALKPDPSYTLRVEGDGQNYATTTTTLRITGRFTTVKIHLQPHRSPVAPHGGTVSAADLRQDVPGAARKEFDAAMEIIKKDGYEEAAPRLERAIELYPDFVAARNELAVAKMKGGDLPGAEVLLRRALEIDPVAQRPLLNLGLCVHRQARYADAVAPLERAVRLDPVNWRAHLLLGVNWVMAGNDPRAEATLLKAYELGGQRAAHAQYYLSRFYTTKRLYERAAKALEIYLRDVPNDPDAAALQETVSKLRTARRR